MFNFIRENVHLRVTEKSFVLWLRVYYDGYRTIYTDKVVRSGYIKHHVTLWHACVPVQYSVWFRSPRETVRFRTRNSCRSFWVGEKFDRKKCDDKIITRFRCAIAAAETGGGGPRGQYTTRNILYDRTFASTTSCTSCTLDRRRAVINNITNYRDCTARNEYARFFFFFKISIQPTINYPYARTHKQTDFYETEFVHDDAMTA